MAAMHTLALFGAALLAFCVCSTRLVAASGRVHIPQCPAITSLLELPDVQACRQVMALAQDPWQGCPALRPVAHPGNPTSRLQADAATELDTAEAEAAAVPGRRGPQPGAEEQRPRHGLRASQLCCTAAQLFMALRCNCWQGLNQQTVILLADQAARCGPLPPEAMAVNPADNIVARMGEEGRGCWQPASAAQSQQQQAHPQLQAPEQGRDSGSAHHVLTASSEASGIDNTVSSGGSSSDIGDPWDAVADTLQEPVHGSTRSSDSSSDGTSSAAMGTAATAQQLAMQQQAHIRLYVAVISMAANRDRRDAVRATWGSDKRIHRLVFVCAKPRSEKAFDALRAEAVRTSDLVMVPHVWEHYSNITHQTFEATRAAALDPAMTHLLKVDDDSYVRVGPLLERLRSLPKAYAFMGYIELGGRPHRDPKNKWYVSPQEWGKAKYPPWAHGAGYVLTADLVREIAAGAALKPQQHRLFKLEDIAMGSWVRHVGRERRVKIQYAVEKRFNYYGCSAYDLVSHYISPGLMYCAWACRGRCCSEREGELYIKQLKRLGGDAAKLQGWRPRDRNWPDFW